MERNVNIKTLLKIFQISRHKQQQTVSGNTIFGDKIKENQGSNSHKSQGSDLRIKKAKFDRVNDGVSKMAAKALFIDMRDFLIIH